MIVYKQCAKCGKVVKDEPGNFKRACRKCGGMVFRMIKPRRKDKDALKTMCEEGEGRL